MYANLGMHIQPKLYSRKEQRGCNLRTHTIFHSKPALKKKNKMKARLKSKMSDASSSPQPLLSSNNNNLCSTDASDRRLIIRQHETNTCIAYL